MALGPFLMTYDRHQVIDFATPFLSDAFGGLVKRIDPELNPWGFVSPFTSFVWFGILFSLIVLVVAFKFVQPTLKDNILFEVLRALLGQSFSLGNYIFIPRMMILSITWLLFTSVIILSYSSALTSSLAVRYQPNSFNTFLDLINDPSLKILIEFGSACAGYVQV